MLSKTSSSKHSLISTSRLLSCYSSNVLFQIVLISMDKKWVILPNWGKLYWIKVPFVSSSTIIYVFLYSTAKSSLQVMDFNNPYQLTLLEQSRTDRDGLLHLEELHDKELEEAQEFRRQCELKEMHALKAYRKAREALIAANNRCSFLYRKREMLSVIASKWSSCRENFSKTSSDLLAEVDHLMVSERQDFDQVGYKFSSQFIDGPLFTSNLKKTGDDLTSGLTDKQGVNVRHPDLNITLSDHENVFADSEACLPVDDESSWSQIVQGSDVLDVGVKTSRDNGSKRTSPVQHVEDCELEAYLRTKLVAKLGTKSSLKSATKGYNTDGTVVKPIEMVAIDEKSSAHLQMIPSVPNQLLQERQKIVEGTIKSFFFWLLKLEFFWAR